MKLSIITINKDNAFGLEKTIQSVINQTYKDFEYIIIDGCSTDGSVDIIKQYTDKITYWVSEPDTGIYNAMNKGIRRAQGEYCLFLNSGDWLISSTTLEDVSNEIANLIPADIFYSNRTTSDGYVLFYSDNITINELLRIGINHQNTLIKRSLFMEHGLYNEDLRIASDTEYFLKEMWIYKSKFTKIKTNISIFDINGIGSQLSPEVFKEVAICYKNVFQELSEPIIENFYYHKSIYYEIIVYFGNTKLLVLWLRIYRFIISRIYKILKFFKNS
jgi:glycosyltransferase involved in cell wall biosynthesis